MAGRWKLRKQKQILKILAILSNNEVIQDSQQRPPLEINQMDQINQTNQINQITQLDSNVPLYIE